MGKAPRARRHGLGSSVAQGSVHCSTQKQQGAAAGSSNSAGDKHGVEPTPFQARVYDLTKRIPAGKVSTYGALAKALNSAPRAVGQALRCNPYAPVVPCHRVIAASLQLGGFSGSWGVGCESVQRKKRMLAEEGVQFSDAGHLLTPDCVMEAAEFGRAPCS